MAERRRLSLLSVESPDGQKAAGGLAPKPAEVTNQRRGSYIRGAVEPGVIGESFKEKKVATLGRSIPANGGIGYACRKGLKPESPNQDDFFVYLDGGISVFGVFDGHGQHGHHISNDCVKTMPEKLENDPSYPHDLDSALTRAFEGTHKAIVDTHGPACSVSGTTASVSVINGGVITTGWCGDSRVAFGRGASWAAMKGSDATRDHKPDLPGERERIEAAGGQVVMVGEGADLPHRVCMRGSLYPALAMSRSLGDTFCQDLGVTCTPEVRAARMEDDFQMLLLCSDGVWEFISTEEAVAVVREFGPDQLNEACARLCEMSWQKWIDVEETVVDDLTAVAVNLKTHMAYMQQLAEESAAD